jgi:hypothetical protein
MELNGILAGPDAIPGHARNGDDRMRFSRIAALAVGLPVLLGGAVAGSAPAAAAAAARTQRLGQDVLVPQGGLSAVTIVSPRLAWAVGSGGDALSVPLIMRWNGTTWAVVPSPAPARGADLFGVAAASAGSAWAVGQTGGTPGRPSQALIEGWDGTSWKQVPSPHPGGNSSLFGVAAVSARSAWAVGVIGRGAKSCPCRALMEHWDGTSWKRVPLPASDGSDFSAVAASGAHSAWAVGNLRDKNGNVLRAVIDHWDGIRWKRVPSPDAKLASLNSVAGSARSAWAVGSLFGRNGTLCACRALIEHWNGTSWKRVPSLASAGSEFLSVSAISARQAWTVGDLNGRALIEHWNGTSWKRVPSASQPRSQTLRGVAASSARSAWAVGDSKAGGGSGLILHWNGTSWR